VDDKDRVEALSGKREDTVKWRSTETGWKARQTRRLGFCHQGMRPL